MERERGETTLILREMSPPLQDTGRWPEHTLIERYWLESNDGNSRACLRVFAKYTNLDKVSVRIKVEGVNERNTLRLEIVGVFRELLTDERR